MMKEIWKLFSVMVAMFICGVSLIFGFGLMPLMGETQPMPPPSAPPIPAEVPKDVVKMAEVVAIWCDNKDCRNETLKCLVEKSEPDYVKCFTQ
jgi:hypothetical protein